MMNLEQILVQYSQDMHKFKRALLREYMQYKILEIIFATQYNNKLSFLGGTALRIIHGNTRFSEDVDFDNFGLSEEEFKELSEEIKRGFGVEGVQAEIRTVTKKAFRCYLKIPEILHREGVSQMPEEKILIQIDTLPHHFDYSPENVLINKFDVFSEIRVTPTQLILSQKIVAAFDRKRAKGRDFYDILFLISKKTKPDFRYLTKTIGVNNSKELNDYITENCRYLNFIELAKDVEEFLIKPQHKEKVVRFPEIISHEFLKNLKS